MSGVRDCDERMKVTVLRVARLIEEDIFRWTLGDREPPLYIRKAPTHAGSFYKM